MNNAPENPPDFLLQTFLILQAIFRRPLTKDDPQVQWDGGRLFLNREELKPPAVHLSEAQLKDRVRELARRVGLPDVSAHPLAEIWRVELAERSLSARELVERGRFASFQRDPHEADLVKRWRDEFMPRLANHLPDLNAVERFDDSATPQDREKKIELAPILEDWPRRILEDPYWKYAEAPLPEMEPLALDDVWVDLFLSDPLEPLEERKLTESIGMRDERQRWLTEPAAAPIHRPRAGDRRVAGASARRRDDRFTMTCSSRRALS